MDQYELKNIIECLLFVSSKPVTVKKFAEVIPDYGEGDIEKVLKELAKGYDVANKSIFIQKVAGGWRMATRKEYGEWVKALFSKEVTYKLSNAALETLAIIAYRQPVTIQEVEIIRGVSAGGVLRGLLEKGLIKIAGRKETIGRPVLYRTTNKFLEYFGLESISDIPPLEELGLDDSELDDMVNPAEDTEVVDSEEAGINAGNDNVDGEIIEQNIVESSLENAENSHEAALENISEEISDNSDLSSEDKNQDI